MKFGPALLLLLSTFAAASTQAFADNASAGAAAEAARPGSKGAKPVLAPAPALKSAEEQGKRLPVHWLPWSDEIFEKAKAEKKLVILDLEAIWCHWCHVMDQQTYASAAVAKELGEHYLCVKVDQDSRPDLSNRYEDYGWPATIIFSSSGEELAKKAGFIEPEDMLSLLKKLSSDPRPEEATAEKAQLKYSKTAALSSGLRDELVANYKKYYDDREGGWQTVQKFLDADCVEYALTLGQQGDKRLAGMARQTLVAELNLLDPVWGGVYQYSTHGDWKHPHFEKIMSVQSENMRIYSLAYLLFKDPRFLAAAEGIASYLHKFLESPEGAFYTSQDADSKQGLASAPYFKLPDAQRRQQGIPRIDKHIYARENGWAIRGLADLYMASDRSQYLSAAEKAAGFILKERSPAGGGFKHGADDRVGPFLGDSLYMGRALLSLYQAGGARKYLKQAEAAADFIDAHFRAGGAAAGYISSKPASKELQEAEPLLDENVALARFCNLLFSYTARENYKKMAESCLRYLATPEIARKRKILIAGILLADREMGSPPAHITISGAKSDPAALKLFQAANRYPLGYKRVEWYDRREGKMPNPDTEYPELSRAAAFACSGQRCSRPAYSADQLAPIVDRTLGIAGGTAKK